MKKIIFVVLILFFVNICKCNAEPLNFLNRETAISKARLSFLLNSVEGVPYDVYIVGYNEHMLTNWLWAGTSKNYNIWAADYFPYIGTAGSQNLTLQNIYLFGLDSYNYDHDPKNKTFSSQRINTTSDKGDGIYVVQGIKGQPDLLVSTIQETGGGSFSTRIFVIKNGQLQPIRFMSKNRQIRESHGTGFEHLTYLQDGTLSVPWWTNAAEHTGRYITVYMMDIKNLILISAYTNKVWTPPALRTNN